MTHSQCAAAWVRLRALATDAARQLDVLGHDGDALGVDCRQVGVLEQTNQVGLEVLRDLTDEALKWQLPDKQLRALLILANLAQRHRAGAVAVGLLDAASGGGRLARGLGRDRGVAPVALLQEAHYHVEGDSDCRAPGPAGRAGQACSV
eukprot:365444-Chlamydomonas_euryale.AAC.6